MATKAPLPKKGTYTITNCTFQATVPSTNEHTVAAITAVSNAAAQLAIAINSIANALKGGNATIDTGIKIGINNDY